MATTMGLANRMFKAMFRDAHMDINVFFSRTLVDEFDTIAR